jgi:ribonuclease HI
MIKNINENDLIIFTDGGARGNPGPAAAGVVIKNYQGKVLTGFGKYLGPTTNNVAEY